MIRVIGIEETDGNGEEVYFTNDLDTPAQDFNYATGWSVSFDEQIEDMPAAFPMEYSLMVKR